MRPIDRRHSNPARALGTILAALGMVAAAWALVVGMWVVAA